MDSLNPQCKVRLCFNCENSAVFFCSKCKQNLCGPCRTKHLNDLSTTHHETVVYKVRLGRKNPEEKCTMHHNKSYSFYCKTCELPLCDRCLLAHVQQKVQPIYLAHNDYGDIIRTIRNEDLRYRNALMQEIQSDIRAANTKIWSNKISPKVFAKAQNLKDLIDRVLSDNCTFLFQFQNPARRMKAHISRIEKYEHRYEYLAIKPTHFISFIKKVSLSNMYGILISWTESINLKDAIQLFRTNISTEKKRGLEYTSPLRLKLEPELRRIKLAETSGCFHISFVKSDRFWVSDNRTNLILFNANGDIERLLKNEIYSDTSSYNTGAHTVNRQNEDLIYIDTNNNIKRVSKNGIEFVCLENQDNLWKYRCVYSSSLSDNLLIGMSNTQLTRSRIVRYKSSIPIQSIQYDNYGHALYTGPCYITENNNGDVVVSDWLNGVVVTDNGGRHRFTFNQDPHGSIIRPKGICTDPMSHLLVCVYNKVMMLDKNGVFLRFFHLMPFRSTIETTCLCFDSITHYIWVGSSRKQCVYAWKYLERIDALLGMRDSLLSYKFIEFMILSVFFQKIQQITCCPVYTVSLPITTLDFT